MVVVAKRRVASVADGRVPPSPKLLRIARRCGVQRLVALRLPESTAALVYPAHTGVPIREPQSLHRAFPSRAGNDRVVPRMPAVLRPESWIASNRILSSPRRLL